MLEAVLKAFPKVDDSCNLSLFYSVDSNNTAQVCP